MASVLFLKHVEFHPLLVGKFLPTTFDLSGEKLAHGKAPLATWFACIMKAISKHVIYLKYLYFKLESKRITQYTIINEISLYPMVCH